MGKKKVVITGIGVLSPSGIGKDAFWRAMEEGCTGIKPVSLFDVSNLKSKQAGEISDFDPASIMGPKGLRTLDRPCKLAICAARLALEDANYKVDSPHREQETGVVLGTVFGIVESIFNFDTVSLKEGPRFVNPAHFPNTVINAPASQISIWEKIKGFNTTLSTGVASGLDALSYAYDFLQLDRAKVILAGGVEGLSFQNYLGFYKINALAGSKNGLPEISCPFDKRRNGIIFGEAGAVLVLETEEHARKRGANIYAEVLGCGSCFDTFKKSYYNPKGTGMAEAMKEALKASGWKPGDIDYISASANSTLDADVAEARAIKKIFGEGASLPVSAIKSEIGETFAPSGILQLIAGINTLNTGAAAPISNYEVPDARCNNLNFVRGPVKIKADKILINAFDPSGCSASAIIGKI